MSVRTLYQVQVQRTYEPRHEKNQCGFQTSCTGTEDGNRLEILDLESRGIVLSL